MSLCCINKHEAAQRPEGGALYKQDVRITGCHKAASKFPWFDILAISLTIFHIPLKIHVLISLTISTQLKLLGNLPLSSKINILISLMIFHIPFKVHKSNSLKFSTQFKLLDNPPHSSKDQQFN